MLFPKPMFNLHSLTWFDKYVNMTYEDCTTTFSFAEKVHFLFRTYLPLL